MAFMVPEYQHGKWYIVESKWNTSIIPVDVVGETPKPENFKDYIEGDYRSHQVWAGWGVRLSAPGYLDCTDWDLFDTEEQCRAHVRSFWAVDDETGNELPEEG